MNQLLINQILADSLGTKSKPFALIYRPKVLGTAALEVIKGDIEELKTLKDIPLEDNAIKEFNDQHNKFLILIPYRQLLERNFAHVDDNASLIAMKITHYQTMPIKDVLKKMPNSLIQTFNNNFDIDDKTYAKKVNNIIANEIGYGEGSNFVLKRQFAADIKDYTIQSALTIFRRLIENETGSYWTFIIHTGERTFVGASPELHVNLNKQVVTMNPISGTYKYPDSGPTLKGFLDFLGASKEADELYMVVEEELKMISRFCPQGGQVVGPFLKKMSRLAHTEYFISGKTKEDVREILRHSLFAPTVIGSPLENACRIIKKYEPKGRGYYAGVAALVGKNALGNQMLDSSILIRTANIHENGHLQIDVGATIVRNSNSEAEASETRAKAQALLDTMTC